MIGLILIALLVATAGIAWAGGMDHQRRIQQRAALARDFDDAKDILSRPACICFVRGQDPDPECDAWHAKPEG